MDTNTEPSIVKEFMRVRLFSFLLASFACVCMCVCVLLFRPDILAQKLELKLQRYKADITLPACFQWRSGPTLIS